MPLADDLRQLELNQLIMTANLFAVLDSILSSISVPASNIKPGGYAEEIFVTLTDQEKEDFECCICYLILKDGKQCINRHKFCSSCIFVWSTSATSEGSDKCPMCRANGRYTPTYVLNSKLKHKRVKCIESNCNWSGFLYDYDSHEHGNTAVSLPPIATNSGASSVLPRNTLLHQTGHNLTEIASTNGASNRHNHSESLVSIASSVENQASRQSEDLVSGRPVERPVESTVSGQNQNEVPVSPRRLTDIATSQVEAAPCIEPVTSPPGEDEPTVSSRRSTVSSVSGNQSNNRRFVRRASQRSENSSSIHGANSVRRASIQHTPTRQASTQQTPNHRTSLNRESITTNRNVNRHESGNLQHRSNQVTQQSRSSSTRPSLRTSSQPRLTNRARAPSNNLIEQTTSSIAQQTPPNPESNSTAEQPTNHNNNVQLLDENEIENVPINNNVGVLTAISRPRRNEGNFTIISESIDDLSNDVRPPSQPRRQSEPVASSSSQHRPALLNPNLPRRSTLNSLNLPLTEERHNESSNNHPFASQLRRNEISSNTMRQESNDQTNNNSITLPRPPSQPRPQRAQSLSFMSGASTNQPPAPNTHSTVGTASVGIDHRQRQFLRISSQVREGREQLHGLMGILSGELTEARNPITSPAQVSGLLDNSSRRIRQLQEVHTLGRRLGEVATNLAVLMSGIHSRNEQNPSNRNDT